MPFCPVPPSEMGKCSMNDVSFTKKLGYGLSLATNQIRTDNVMVKFKRFGSSRKRRGISTNFHCLKGHE
ncbi:hypothetical protein G3M48_004597 [Beauveria asiatica]|uniref:Uncharacterized protein n=1 Tax=Beauveria asiatica TaxID=1069075 RepID=A0AAW0S6W2_9HYPO